MPDPTPQILEAAQQFRQQLLARERRAASAMVRYYGDTWRRLQPEIRRLRSEIEEMRAAGEDVSVGRIGRLERLRSIEAQAQQELLQFTEYANDAISGAEREAIAAAERDAPALMRAAYPLDAPITVMFDRMPREAVENLVGFLQDGSPLKDLLDEAVGAAVDDFASTMVTGMAAGWNPRRLARTLRSEFGMGLTQALKISRTEQLRAYSTATLDAYQTSNVTIGWERMAALSPRTCMACLELDGTRYALDEPMDDHVQGRCAMLPITKSYAEMGIDAPEPDFTREKGHDWFLRQDEGTQRRVLGDGMFDAWKEGQFKLEDVPKLTKSRIWGNSWTPKALGELVAEAEKARPWAKPTIAPESYVRWKNSKDYDAQRFADYGDRHPVENAKREAMRSVAARLKGDPDFERFVLERGAEVQLRGVSNDPNERTVAGLIHHWAASSGDNDLVSVALQRMAEDEFGAMAWHWGAGIRQDADAWVEGHEVALRKYLRAMYDNTQELLERDGIESLFLWRGMGADNLAEGFSKVQLRMQAMSSFSAREVVATGFTGGGPGQFQRVLIGTEVPRERILSTYGQGYGCAGEAEYVVLGGETEAWMFTTRSLTEVVSLDEPGFIDLIYQWVRGQS